MPALPYWLWPGDDRPTPEIDDEIAEELRLHLELMAEQQMREGQSPEEAKRLAAKRFGDFDTVLRRCRAEKQGDVPMLKRIQAVLMLLLLAAVVWLGVRDYMTAATTTQYMNKTTKFLTTIHSDLTELRDTLTTVASANQPEANLSTDSIEGAYQRGPVSNPLEWPSELVVLLRDAEGIPISNATVVTWRSAGRRAGNSPSSVNSNSHPVNKDGRFKIPLPLAGLAVFAPDYAAMTCDVASLDPAGDHALDLRLPRSTPLELRIMRPDGKPARHATVILSRRTNLADVTFDFPIMSDSLRRQTDDKGNATLDWSEPNDLVTLLVKERGQPISSAITVKFEVPNDPGKVVKIALQEPSGSRGGEFGGGFGGGGEYGGGGVYGGSSKPYEVSITSDKPDAKEEPTAVEDQ